jgi:hypothetical protein
MVDVIMKLEVKTFDIFERGDDLLEQRMSIARFSNGRDDGMPVEDSGPVAFVS